MDAPRSLIGVVVLALALALPASAGAGGYFTPQPLALDSLPSGAEHVAVGDFDGDGRDDIAASVGDEIVVRLNASAPGDTDATFTAGPTLPTSQPVTDLVAADFNRDGRDDLIAARGATAVMRTFFSGTQGVLGHQGSVGVLADEVEAADLDGDGVVDLAYTSSSGGEAAWVRSMTPAGATTLSGVFDATPVSGPANLVVVGNSGIPDLALSDGTNHIHWLKNGSTPGSASFTDAVSGFLYLGVSALAPVQADGDAIDELAVSAPNAIGLVDLTGASPQTLPALDVGVLPEAMAGGDLDGQGDNDELLTVDTGGTLTAYEDLSNSPTQETIFPLGTSGTAATMALGSFSGDTAQDVAIGLAGSATKLQVGVSRSHVNPTPTSLAFGDQIVGTQSPSQRVTLSNDGWAPLTVLGALTTPVANGADFGSNAGDCLGIFLPFGIGSCAVDVRFTPGAAGARFGTLEFQTPFRATEPTVVLSGNGTTGPIFPQGPPGNQGPQGNAGTNGAAGPAGTNGATGPQGPAGANGATGAKGATGATGAPGKNGGASCTRAAKGARTVCEVTLTATKKTSVEATLTGATKVYAQVTGLKGFRKGAKLRMVTQRDVGPGVYRLQFILRRSTKVPSTQVSFPATVR
jgi:hypothetical protein